MMGVLHLKKLNGSMFQNLKEILALGGGSNEEF